MKVLIFLGREPPRGFESLKGQRKLRGAHGTNETKRVSFENSKKLRKTRKTSADSPPEHENNAYFETALKLGPA